MKTLCDLSKNDIEKHAKKITKSGSPLKYFCGKCACVSNTKKQVCYPEKIKTK